MTSKEALEYIRKHPAWQYAAIHGMNQVDQKLVDCFKQVEKDLEVLESIKEVFKKVTYEPEYSYEEEDENGMIPIKYAPKVKIAEDFDRELFRQVLEQCGFEIKEK